ATGDTRDLDPVPARRSSELTGATGATGPTGTTGATGAAGGAITVAYTFDTTTTNADPGSGKLRLNAATENTATATYVNPLDTGATDWTAVRADVDTAARPASGQVRL